MARSNTVSLTPSATAKLDAECTDGALGMRRTQHRQARGEAVAACARQLRSDALHAPERRLEEERLGKGASIAVCGADRVGEPAQLTTRTPRSLEPLTVHQLHRTSAEARVVLVGASRTARADPGDVDLVDALEPRSTVPSEHAAQARGERRAHHDRHPVLDRLAIELSRDSTSVSESDTETTGRRRASSRRTWCQVRLGRAREQGGIAVRDRIGQVAVAGPAACSAIGPSTSATVARFAACGSHSKIDVTPGVEASCRAARVLPQLPNRRPRCASAEVGTGQLTPAAVSRRHAAAPPQPHRGRGDRRQTERRPLGG